MRYTSVFTVSFDADDDRTASAIAHQHHQQILDQLRVEGADHPHEFTLDRVIAEERAGPRVLAIVERESV